MTKNRSLVSNSQFQQDIWVISLFKGKIKGFFIEIGGGDGLWISNTLLLEREFEWNGILVEPTSAFELLKKNRPNCITDNSCIASERKSVTLFEIFDRGQAMLSRCAKGNTLLSMVKEDIDRHEGQKLNSEWGDFQRAYQKKAVLLEDVLRKYNAPKVIDYFSLDVEGFEYEILKNFPFHEYIFLCLGVERPPQKLHNLLIANGYMPRARLGEDMMYTHSS
ncbi:MAG: FkbM family methyltransferase, partial [Gammaproteobacteria bacterium]